MEYRTIVVDPPWVYERFIGRKQGRGVVEGWEQKSLPYPCMNLEQMSALPVSKLADDDARLFLWTTNRYLPAALPLMDSWGFRYRQTLVWHKTSASPYPGSVAVIDLEFLLVGQRGSPGRPDFARSSLISTSIKRNHADPCHSQKPEAVLDLIEQVSPGPYLEMFARRQRLGWDTWGDEALNHVEISA